MKSNTKDPKNNRQMSLEIAWKQNILVTDSNLLKSFLSKIQNRISEKTGKKILLFYGKISRYSQRYTYRVLQTIQMKVILL